MLTQKILQVRTIFDQNPTIIRNHNLPNQDRVLEVEAKYGHYGEKGFGSYVPYIHYERLLTRLRGLPNIGRMTTEESEVAQSGNIRRITIINVGDEPETIIWQRKSRIQDIDLPQYDIRISSNLEEKLAANEIPTNFTPTNIRNRTRTSFTLVDGLVKVDLTEVMMLQKGTTMLPRYEVEVEYLGDATNIGVFAEQVEYIFRLLRGTNIIYTNEIKNKLIVDVVKILGSTRPDMIDKDVLVEARNIKRRDLLYGGIVGNEHVDDDKILATPRRPEKQTPGTNYMITFKADGLRKMLIIHTTGIWLVYPPYEFNLVLDTSLNVPQLDKLLLAMNGTIFDGELVVPRVPKNIAYWYLAFDCLAFRNNAGIQRQPYTDRQKVVNAVSDAIKTPILTMNTKESKEIKTPQDFFRLVNEFLDKRDLLEYDEDGLIFVPIDTYYNPMSQRYPLKDRALTHIPDTCKWKHGEDITIDFALKWLPNNMIDLQSYDDVKGEVVSFKGDTINPLTPDMIDHTNPLTLNKPYGLVVEYEWIWLPNKKGMFRPRRLRPEKSGANRLSIALDDWEDIMNPVTEKDIRGESLNMVFSYHNRIKKSLYDLLTQNPDYNPRNKGSKRYKGINILDIGSGRGGDTAKWLRLKDQTDQNTGFVVAVEPNVDNREELVRRIATFGLQDKVLVVPTGGEDTVSITEAVRRHIPGGKVDAVTLMLSMSFFWASDSHLESLVQTILSNLKPGGKIVFLTIDGDTIEQIFEPALGGEKITDLILDSTRLHLYSPSAPPFGRAIDFILPDTIVGEQREYLVHLQDFSRRLANYGINLNEIHRAETEKLLSNTASLFSSMYSFGYYTNDDKNALTDYEKPGLVITNIPLPTIPPPINYPAMQMIPSPTPIINPPVVNSPKVMIPQIPISPKIPIPKAVLSPIIPKIPVVPTQQPTKYQIDHNQLRWLNVSYTGRGGKIVPGPAENDDTYAPLTCTWYPNLVRIATIGDGSCFIHSVMKAFYRDYQENNSALYRLELSAKLRRDLAYILGSENPRYPGRTFWETSGRGGFPRMVTQQIQDEELVDVLKVDYSLAGLQRLFNSTSYLGDEVYTFVADALNVDIYVLRATKDDLYPHYHTRRPDVPRNGIVIVGNTYHYEVLAVDTKDGFQTVFPQGDPFLDALTKLFVGDGDFNDIINTVPYDPDAGFIFDFVGAFATRAGFAIPPVVNEIFPDTDPFIMTLNRLMPRIEEAAQIRVADLNRPATPRVDSPIVAELDRILEIMERDGFNTEDINNIREIVRHRIDPDVGQTLDHIIAGAETDGLITHDIASAIIQRAM
ncbi:MAG: hypothetical protein ABIQ41_01335 [Gemmatimonadales bacterium]